MKQFRKAIEHLAPAWAAVLALSCGAELAGAAEWYAEVETTGGDFTIALEWESAPNGCEAFSGLAEGLADWVNPQSGKMEHGVEYYPGTAVSWGQRDEAGDMLLVGNRGRIFTGSGGTTNADNGAGVEFPDDLREGGGRNLAARSVAMMNREKPDSLDGRWAIFLKEGNAYYGGQWSRIGTVVSNWAVVEALAARERDPDTGLMVEPATVTGVQVWSDPADVAAAWRVGATNFPSCTENPLDLRVAGTNGSVRFKVEPRSHFSFVRKGDLADAAIVIEDWNEEHECRTNELAFLTVPAGESDDGIARFGTQHFFSAGVSEVSYPALTGPALPGNGYGLLTEWQWRDGSVDQYLHVFDWVKGTGMVWKATEGGGWTNTALVLGMDCWRDGAHCGQLAMAEVVLGDIWSYIYRYWLGAPGADGVGRFRMEVFAGFSGTVTVWGDYGWVKIEAVLSKKGGASRREVCNHPMGNATEPTRDGWRGKMPGIARKHGVRRSLGGDARKRP